MALAPHLEPDRLDVPQPGGASIGPLPALSTRRVRLQNSRLTLPSATNDKTNAQAVRKGLWRAFYRLEIAVLFLICMVTAFLYTTAWGAACIEPHAIEYEGHVLWACLKLSQWQNIYDASTLVNQPWGVIIYNPLYFLIGAGLLKVIGPEFWPLRVLSMFSTLLSFFGFFALLKRSKLNNFQSVLVLCLLACSLPFIHWSSVARVDMLGLCLAIWGMERFATRLMHERAQEERSFSSMLPCLTLFILAFFTKQQYFVFPLSCTLFLVVNRQYRQAFQFTGVFLALTLLVASLLQITTQGYWAHLSYAMGLPWEWRTLKSFIVPFFLDRKTVAAMLVILAGKILARSRAPLENLATLLLAVSFVAVVYTMGLRAAYHNHLLCTVVALFWLAAINLRKLGIKSTAPTVMLTGAVLGFGAWAQYYFDLNYRLLANKNTPQTLALFDRSRMQGKLVLTEDPSLALFVGAIPVMVDATTILNIERSHPQALDALLEAIAQQKYAAVVIDRKDANTYCARIWPKSVVEAIWLRYRLIGKCGGNGTEQDVFLPR